MGDAEGTPRAGAIVARNCRRKSLNRGTKHGNSYALVIDRAILELLRLDPNSPLEISTDGTALIVQPVRDARRRKRFEKALKRTNKGHGKTLKKLVD